MIRIHDIKLPLDYSDSTIKRIVCKELGIDKNAIEKLSLYRRSVDARKKDNVHFIAAVDVTLSIDENKVIRKSRSQKADIAKPYEYKMTDGTHLNNRPVVVGFGPAGMFAALILAQSGAKPMVIERGFDVDTRTSDVEKFWKSSVLNTQSNVQFGEGGAGTFSDGKLNTGTKDTRSRKVLEEFAKHGADKEILYNAKPHIGTDKLKGTVKSIREEIIRLGGEVHFGTQLTSLLIKDNRITAVKAKTTESEIQIETDNVVLAIGHSARDTFEMLYDMGVTIIPKAFSVGARIEHLREKIDQAQYGSFAGNKCLGSSSYKMNVHLNNGRGVYTFCMCPGGTVVAAASEENTVVTNGMSEFARDSINSNAALLVGVTPSDFNSDHPLAGMYFQRELERKAFVAGGGNYSAPLQRVDDFLNRRKTVALGEVKPSYMPNCSFALLDDCLPQYVTDSMREGIVLMNKRLNGFSDGDALLTGVESRSSSPIRIVRNPDTMECVTISGLYPCGEGAGYAGGIISAAVDGIKCAEKILSK
ncbi:MAG: NAD(P)/FAD-dependent oxidoreductase [Acutalibacteraceae bacterium]